MKTQKTNKRPHVLVSALTADTVEIIIEHDEGAVRIVAEHGGILVEANGTKVRTKP